MRSIQFFFVFLLPFFCPAQKDTSIQFVGEKELATAFALIPDSCFSGLRYLYKPVPPHGNGRVKWLEQLPDSASSFGFMIFSDSNSIGFHSLTDPEVTAIKITGLNCGKEKFVFLFITFGDNCSNEMLRYRCWKYERDRLEPYADEKSLPEIAAGKVCNDSLLKQYKIKPATMMKGAVYTTDQPGRADYHPYRKINECDEPYSTDTVIKMGQTRELRARWVKRKKWRWEIE